MTKKMQEPEDFKRPTPPPLFKRYTNNNGCPECGARIEGQPKSSFPSVWHGSDWQDPVAQAAYDARHREVEEWRDRLFNYKGDGDRYEVCGTLPVFTHELKCDWSRYGLGECLKCGIEIWHDFGGGGPAQSKWHYYYKPLNPDPIDVAQAAMADIFK